MISTDVGSYDMSIEIKRSKYIDAIDEKGSWLLAELITILEDENSVKIKFDGWFDKYITVFLHYS